MSEPSAPARYVVELRDVGLRGLSLPYAGPSRRGGHGRHRRAVPGQHPADHRPTPGPSLAARPDLVNLAVRRGELITITGPTGSGKSALLHVIGLADRPVTGSYLLNGRDTGKLGDRGRAALRGRQIGLQFQRPHLLTARTALDNVALPLGYAGVPHPRRTDTALVALDQVGLADRAQVMIARLSCAERKLVAIARALATDPSLVLLDDPTAGMDETAAARIVALLIGLHRDGRTVLVATDDQLTTAYSSRQLALPSR